MGRPPHVHRLSKQPLRLRVVALQDEHRGEVVVVAREADVRGAEQTQVDVHDPEGVRLQKLLAAAGVGSRRVCENLIEQGRVEVDGQVVTELGVRIRADQVVHVDGVRIHNTGAWREPHSPGIGLRHGHERLALV